jgi:ribosome biogenesis GTPase / thiamine phosphate phosphatase
MQFQVSHSAIFVQKPLFIFYWNEKRLNCVIHHTFVTTKSFMQIGTVIKSTGSWYNVRFENGVVWQCRIVGKFRLDNLPLTNPIAVGDLVEVHDEGPMQGMIRKILPRKNYIARRSPQKKHELHLLASNIDQAVLILTIVNPSVKPGFIDRFLLTTEPHEIPVTLIFNKGDIYDQQDVDRFFELKNIYEKIGYQVLATSVVDNKGLDAFRDLLKDKITLLSGQSGVGKSSLVNAVQPLMDLRTGDISDYSGKGQHTTTFAEMHTLDFGGSIIDTPGIKVLAFNNKDVSTIAHSFREFFKLSPQCRFGGSCMHRNEPGCAVQAAIATGEVSSVRYSNYLQLLEEVEDVNYWERNKDF